MHHSKLQSQLDLECNYYNVRLIPNQNTSWKQHFTSLSFTSFTNLARLLLPLRHYILRSHSSRPSSENHNKWFIKFHIKAEPDIEPRHGYLTCVPLGILKDYRRIEEKILESRIIIGVIHLQKDSIPVILQQLNTFWLVSYFPLPC